MEAASAAASANRPNWMGTAAPDFPAKEQYHLPPVEPKARNGKMPAGPEGLEPLLSPFGSERHSPQSGLRRHLDVLPGTSADMDSCGHSFASDRFLLCLCALGDDCFQFRHRSARTSECRCEIDKHTATRQDLLSRTPGLRFIGSKAQALNRPSDHFFCA